MDENEDGGDGEEGCRGDEKMTQDPNISSSGQTTRQGEGREIGLAAD